MNDSEVLDGIAIVGMAGRFPRSKDLLAYWRNLREGVEMITFFDEDAPAEAPTQGAHLVRARGLLDDIDRFDSAFFGYTPRIAEVMDPQHRLFLECAWQALEDAGYDSDSYSGAVGVFAGASRNTYFLSNLLTRPDILRDLGPHQVATVSDGGFLSTRVSYKLNLRGPSLTVQTTCSTSLVAVHLACQSLLNGECDMALAGGSSVGVPQKAGHLHQEGGIFSADGHCRAFDAQATGTVSGSGVGVVVLKRLADALADGDSIRTVIRGSAVNNDGSEKIGYTAPSVEGQAAVIAEALNVAGIDPATVTYVEAHGTGTALGDPIEIVALQKAYGARDGHGPLCAIGSVKTNMGHLDEAAGISGLIKTVLMLQNREIPPSLHFERPNPQIDFVGGPFFVNRELRPWEANGTPRRAGVSSFGLGGTNAHLILEEAPAPAASDAARPWQLLVLSARTGTALDAVTAELAGFLRRGDAPGLADVAYTLQVGRRPFEHRRSVVCRNGEDAASALEACRPERVHTGAAGSEQRFAAFLFPGQGAQAVGMGRALYESEPVFRELVDRSAGLLQRDLGLDLRRVLYPAPTEAKEAARALDETRLAQPALFVVEHALAALWRSWGVEPRALLGHSVGEYVAACLAGVFSLEDALALVAARGRMMQDLPAGAMLAVPLAADRVRALLGPDLSLAAVNAAERSVVSGPEAAVEGLRERLAAEGVTARRLRTSHAFHSGMMEPVLGPFAERVGRVALQAPSLPYVSNLTGTWIRPEEATDPGYWARHLRETVLFQAGLELLLAETGGVLLEVGAGHTLTALARRAGGPGADRRTVASLAAGPDDLAGVLDAAGRLWTAGLLLDWTAFHGGTFRRRVPLPTYPFERKSHWIEARPPVPAAAPEVLPAAPAAAPRTTRKERILTRLGDILGRLFGVKPGDLDVHTSFLDMGADSLLLLQANDAIQKALDIKLSFFQLIDECPNLDALAEHLDARLPADRLQAEEEKSALAPLAAAPVAPPPVDTDLRAVIAQQIELNNQVLRLLAGGGSAASASPVKTRAETPRAASAFPFDPVKETGGMRLTPRQQEHLDGLIAGYTARTAESKRRTEIHRFHLADNRNSVGFRLAWKEMVYPILGERSRGSRLWDVDGNEYVDLAMGFGVNMLGHSPDFIREAVREQLDKGMHVGPQSDLAGEVATLIHEITGMERVTFANSGTEAVMTALRLARAVTGRHKIAFFTGSYHGSADGVLFGGMYVDGELRAVPRVPGVPPGLGADLLVLEYGTPQSLETIAAHGHELAAVLVEPVQSRRPELQPREYLHELRRLTEKTGAALIFDETITGFRPHPRGAQGVFDLNADIVTYGKVVGGGMPIGVITGIPRFMDAIDGGTWRFGDASAPETAKTFFAGTFCKHPLAMAAARASLRFMKEQGPGLQRRLNEQAEALVGELNRYFAAEELGIRMVHFGSQMMFVFSDPRFSDLFFLHLVHEGVFVWEGRTCFLSISHTDEDIRFVVRAIEKSVEEMRRGGFFPERSGAMPTLPAAPRAVPLTAGQRQIWIEAQVGPDASSAYNETFSLRLSGRFDIAALSAAVQEVADRHEALRTTFGPDGDVQWIAPRLEVSLEVADFAAGEDRAARLDVWRRSQERDAFDLVRGPLFRVGVARLDTETHLMVLTIHHLVVDAWSLGLLLQEMGAIYTARLAGTRIELPLPGRFGEYAVRGPAEGDLEAARRFWLELLAGEIPVLELPTDFPRPALKTYAGARVASAAAPGLFREVKALAVRQRATPFVVLLAAFEVLLHRLTGQDDLVVGVPSAGQPRAGEDRLVGFCINLLALRSRVEGNPSFAEHLARTRQTFGGAYEHQDYPLGRLLADLKLAPDFSRSPLVAAAFNMDWSVVGGDGTPPEAAALRIVPVEPVTAPAKFDLGFDVVEVQGELQMACTWNTDLFRASTVLRWMAAYEEILRSVCADPAQPAAEISLLTDAESHQILREWGAGEPLPVPAVTLPRLIEEQVARTPDRIAVSCEGGRLTYRELNAAANHLARRLREAGAGPDVPVGICAERSLEMVVALLAILKAGGAYLPLDPDYPADRLAFLLEDAAAPALLAQDKLLAGLPPNRSRVFSLEEATRSLSEEMNPGCAVDPASLAYVIYTSGSTGRPKGTMNTHAGIVNRLLWMQAQYRLTPEDKVLQKTPFSFDVSVWELFWPLLTGACLVVARPGGHRDGAYLVQTIAEEGITTLHFVPSMLGAFLEAPGVEGCASLQRVFCSGEALPPDLERRFHTRSGAQLHNLYGPTEAAVDVTWWRCERESAPGFVPIGRPVANTRIHLLDADRRPVPAGVVGELYIGGIQLARGYLARPALTAEKFVPDPFAAEPGARLYRTGDLARFLPDGAADFLGRIDHQVKIRGFRIEPGEIEAALLAVPGVRTAVVLAREDAPGDRRLVAYVVLQPEASLEAAELRAALRESLPDHMVPGAFVALDELPLTPSGKLDRKALPKPDWSRGPQSAALIRTPLEELVAGLWSEVLGTAVTDAEASFFEMGGDSLLATRVLARIRRDFAVELSLRTLFEAPTIRHLARCIEPMLAPGFAPALPTLRRVPRGADLPLSFSQQRLWFLDQLQPGSPLYNIPAALRIRGRLVPGALEQAFREIGRRHEVLRTGFFQVGGEPVQRLRPEACVDLPVVDLGGLPAALREPETGRLAAAEALLPFDLSRPPLLRTTLLRLDAEEHVALITVHHIASDGWSMGVLVRECGTLYEAFAAGLGSPLPELPLQYADFAVWQREWMSGDCLAAEVELWRSRLAGAPPVLELPADRPRPAQRGSRGSARTRSLPARLAESLRALARRESVTSFMLQEAAFEALLLRLTGQRDFCVGTPVAGRGHLEVEALIGFFVNTLVLRATPAGEIAFRALVAQVRDRVLEAHLHQDLPFEKLVEELEPRRSLDRSPIFQVMFQLDRLDPRELALEGLTLSHLPAEIRTAKFDLLLAVVEQPDGLAGSFVYSSDLFDGATIERLLGHWETLLAGLAADPDRALGDVPLLTEAETAQLLARALPPVLPPNRCLHRMFEEQAARRPDAAALVSGETLLTYGVMNRRANQLARRLRALGVGPEVPVALCLERSAELVVALLAILKAGGAYVPLDPAYPRERLAFLLEDSGASVLVTAADQLAALPATAGASLLLLDAIPDGGEDCADLPVPVADGNAAYVIYTSGSTGRPKGVVVTHANVCRLFTATEGWFGFAESDVWTLFHSCAFDFSVWEIWGALLYGGRLVVVPFLTSRSPEVFHDLLQREGVTLLSQTPSAFRQLAAADAAADGGRDLPLRQVVFGGEALAPALLEPWIERHGEHEPRLVNMYGITETTVHVTWREIGRDDLRAPSRSPIGIPIPDLCLYVCDERLQLLPVGVSGELYVGGAGLARGYLARPDLTAARFVPDPFAAFPGERLYRTGDLVRRLPNGDLEYLGRTDQQVKIRGFRIEPGEIEAALATHPAITAGIVVVREDAPGDKRLVAYVLLDPQLAPAPGEFRAFLAERLPAHMIPAAIVPLPALPLTSNGKLDRAALPVPEQAAAPGEGKAEPRNQVEAVLAEMWAGAFYREAVGLEEGFFELGGHSLMAVQMAARIREVFAVDLPLRCFFETPRLVDLAARIETAMQEDEGLRRPRIVPAARDRQIPLSFGQQRLWFLDRLQPGATMYNLPSHVRLDCPLDTGALERSLQEIVRRHKILRSSFQEVAGQPVQVIAPFEPEPLPVIDLAGLPADRREGAVSGLAHRHSLQPFDLRRCPLLRCALVRLEREAHVLLLTTHHIASDGRSMEILMSELSALYRAFAAGGPSPLHELPVQYADFAAWQRSWLQGERLESQLAYWRRQLAGAPPLLRLVTDRPRPPVQTFRGHRFEMRFPAETIEPLRALCRDEQVTPFMALFAVYLAVLHRHSGEEDLVIGTPIAYRHLPEIENLIGFFVNTLVLRTDLSGNPTFRTLLSEVRRGVLDAFMHQDVPFDKIVEDLQPARNPSYSPLFQVGFNFLQKIEGPAAAPGEIRAVPLDSENETIQFELALTVLDAGGEIRGAWYYNVDLFDAWRVRRMADDFHMLLKVVLEAPDLPLTDLNERLAEAHRREAAERENERKQRSSRALGQVRRKAIATGA